MSTGLTTGRLFAHAVPHSDPAFDSRTSGITLSPSQLSRLPRRRRPGMVALALALVGAGIVASAAVYETTNHRTGLATIQPLVPGQALVPLGFKPAMLPASGLSPGDRVLIVATPGDQGQPGSLAAPVLNWRVPGLVAAITPAVNADGYQVVDVLVAAGAGAAVIEQASTGQIALIVIKRASR